MKNIILDADETFRPKTDHPVQVRIDGDLYDVKRPKKAVGAVIQRLAQQVDADPESGSLEDVVRTMLKAFLVHESDVQYLAERALDLDDELDLDFLGHTLGVVQQHFEDTDTPTPATPSAKARAVRPPTDRAPKTTAKKTAAKAAAKPAAAGQ